MTSKSSSFKVGVLNMTICFQSPKQRLRQKRDSQPKNVKMHAIPVFIPRSSLQKQNNNVSIQKHQEQMSPYQRYQQSHKESIRYFRQHYQSTKKEKNIQGLSPKNNKTIQLKFNDNFFEQEKIAGATKQTNDLHLRLVYNKRHLRNTADLSGQSKTESFVMCFSKNPEENLKNIFTVRTINTGSKSRRKISFSDQKKIVFRAPKTKQEIRFREKKLQDSRLAKEIKEIRPWSPTRDYFSKEPLFYSEILSPLQHRQVNNW